jgi:hypothetical protein
MKDILCNDKFMVILAVWIIALVAMSIYGESSENIVTAVVSGLFGIATGRSMTGSPPTPPA